MCRRIVFRHLGEGRVEGEVGGGITGTALKTGKKIQIRTRPCETLNVTVIPGRLQTHLFISKRNRTECFACPVLMMKRKNLKLVE